MEFVSVIQVGRIKASAPVVAAEEEAAAAAAMEIYPCDHKKVQPRTATDFKHQFWTKEHFPWLTVIYLEFGRLVYQRHHILDVTVAIKYLHLGDSRASCSYFRDHLCDAVDVAATVWYST